MLPGAANPETLAGPGPTTHCCPDRAERGSSMTGSTHAGFRLRARTTRTLTAGALVLAAGLATTGIPGGSYAAGQSSPAPAHAERSAAGGARGFYDVRAGASGSAHAAQLRTSSRASSRPAARALRRSLPGDAL